MLSYISSLLGCILISFTMGVLSSIVYLLDIGELVLPSSIR